jgi:alpha-galactosidase
VPLTLPRPPVRYYRQGWQSWSLAAWTETGAVLPVQKPRLLHPMQTDPLYVNDPRPNGSWVGAVEFEDGKILLLGALGTDSHVALNGNKLEGWYESGPGEWLVTAGDEKSVFADFVELLETGYGSTKDEPAPRVWCSWYSLYTAIDEPILYRVFDDLDDLPFDVLQVDDGWQISVGDWDANAKFPSGMTTLAARIRSTGRRAGLWLAPLIAVRSSRLFREHQDWFLRDTRGRLVSAGFNWGEPLYALDTTHPAALEWLAGLMKQVRTWGFDYLKLDFLYAGALPGKRHVDTPREAAYRNGLKVLRDSMGADAFFLTCGAPIIPSLGLCDALRIGPDVAAEWENRRDARQLHNLTTPGTRNAIRTTLNRLWLAPLLHIDPDVVYFRSKECQLSRKEKTLLQDLALICEFKATSDLPQWLTKKERDDLRAFLKDNHKPRQTGAYTFQIGKRQVDFEGSMGLPERAQGLEALQGAAIGWLGSQGWALKVFDRMGKNSLNKMKAALERPHRASAARRHRR